MGAFVDMISSKGKGANSTFRPEAGTVCLVSGPNCDDENGFVFSEMTILWRNDIFVLYGNEGFYPNLNRWDHVICKKKPERRTVWVIEGRNPATSEIAYRIEKKKFWGGEFLPWFGAEITEGEGLT
jgi:hypothetical protein